MEPFLREMQREEYAPIAVYGTGVNAERVLRSALGERVSFVVAREHVGEQFLGHEVQALAVPKDRVGPQVQRLRNLGGRLPLGNPSQNLQFPPVQRFGQIDHSLIHR